MKDDSDNYTTQHELFNLPMRLLFIAKTGDAKSTTLGNYLLKDEGYKNNFEPENVYIFSGSLSGDIKMNTIITELDIPIQNTFKKMDNDILNIIYDMLVDNYNENIENGIKDKKKLNSLIVFDDLAFNDTFKDKGKFDGIKRVFFNGRKFLVSCIIISQKYSSISTNLRENASGLVIGKASNKQLDLIEQDHNYLKGKNGKKDFKELFRKTTEEPFSKFIINFSKKHLYFNQDMEPLDY